LEKVVEAEGGFYREESKNKWFKELEGKNYLDHFDYYINVFKPEVDKLIDSEQPGHITKVSPADFDDYSKPVMDRYRQRLVYAKQHKITRLSWNSNHWR